jgi:hypothetical protein
MRAKNKTDEKGTVLFSSFSSRTTRHGVKVVNTWDCARRAVARPYRRLSMRAINNTAISPGLLADSNNNLDHVEKERGDFAATPIREK